MALKLVALAPRHTPTPRGSSRTNRHGAQTTTFGVTTARVHCKGPRLRNEIVPKLLLLPARDPASTVRVASRHRNREIVPKSTSFGVTTPRVHCKGRHFLASRQALRIEIGQKLSVLASRHRASTVKVVTFGVMTSPTNRNGAETTSFGVTTTPRTPRSPRGSSHMHPIVPKPQQERRRGSATVAPR